jgi:hypothetical protein
MVWCGTHLVFTNHATESRRSDSREMDYAAEDEYST